MKLWLAAAVLSSVAAAVVSMVVGESLMAVAGWLAGMSLGGLIGVVVARGERAR